MKIPIKRYVPDEEALRDVCTVLSEQSEYKDTDPVFRIAREYDRLSKHHEEETKWMVERIRQLELLCKD